MRTNGRAEAVAIGVPGLDEQVDLDQRESIMSQQFVDGLSHSQKESDTAVRHCILDRNDVPIGGGPVARRISPLAVSEVHGVLFTPLTPSHRWHILQHLIFHVIVQLPEIHFF